MTTKVHTDVPAGAAANASTWNAPLGQLDQAIADVTTDLKVQFALAGDGATDDGVKINSGLLAIAQAGGGEALLPPTPGMVYAVATSLIAQPNVRLRMAPGVSIKWTGATNSVVLTSSPTTVLNQSDLVGTIDCNNISGVVGYYPHSLQRSYVDLLIKNVTGTGTPAAKMWADVATAYPAPLFQAMGFNDISIVVQNAPIGISWRGFAAIAPATLNKVRRFQLSGITQIGLDLVETCDTNEFDVVDVIFTANGAVGIVLNDLAPVNNDHDAKGVHFGRVSFTAQGGVTGCTGITFNWTSGVVFDHVFYDASAFAGGGQLLNDVTGRGYILHDAGQFPNVIVYNNQAIKLIASSIADSVLAISNVASFTPDAVQASLWIVDYNQNLTINPPTAYSGGGGIGGVPFTNHGRRLTFRFRHDATATAYTITWTGGAGGFKRAGGAFANTNTANAIDTITFEFDSTTGTWNEVARALNLS